MTENERILVEGICQGYFRGEDMAICGSIQNFRRFLRKNGRILSFPEAAKEWNDTIFIPIMDTLRNDPATAIAAGSNITSAFFSALYAIEGNKFLFNKNIVRNEVLRKAHGIRAFLSKLIA